MIKRNLVLGTANWGRLYGNSKRSIGASEAHDILDFFLEQGYYHIDTAYNYGEAHEYLSTYHRINELVITTKFQSEIELNQIIREIEYSGIKFQTIMFHDVPTDKERVLHLIESGVENVGISLNSIREMEVIRGYLKELNKVQVPYNIVDRRWEEFFFEFKSFNLEIEARSAFLQGQLLVDNSFVLSQNAKLNDELKTWKANRTIDQRLMSCVKFQKNHKCLDSFVFGVDSMVQLQELVETFNESSPYIEEFFLKFDDESLLLPMNW